MTNRDTQAPAPAPPRTPEQIQADIDAAQQQLAATVDELSDRLSPQSLADEATGVVKGWFVHPDGSVKGKPIAIIGGTLAGLIVLRQIFHD
ncbi:MAG: DUF3618 domain-containing protein [Actinomycetes bacterium]